MPSKRKFLNEAVTNAIKHAFTGRSQEGTTTISFKQVADNLYEMTIGDDGIGLPAFKA